MWDKEEVQKLVELGLTFEQAKIAIGRIAEHRQVADGEGYNRGFDAGWKEGYDTGHRRGYAISRGQWRWPVEE